MSGAQNGARKAPLAPSTWMSTSSPVSACSVSSASASGCDQLVGAGVGDAERRHDHDRVLVDAGEHVVDVHRVVPGRHRHLAHLDVPVLGELVPHDLDRPAHHVRSIRRLAGRGPLRPPAPLGGHPAEHARLGRPDRRRAHRVGGLGRVPQVGEHVHAPPLDLRRLRVLVLVDHVLVDRQVHQPVHLGLLPRLAERRQVLAGVAVEHQLVGDDGEGVLGAPLLGREAILGCRLRHVLAGVDGVVERGTDGFTSVQRHWSLLRCVHGGSASPRPTVRRSAGSGHRPDRMIA